MLIPNNSTKLETDELLCDIFSITCADSEYIQFYPDQTKTHHKVFRHFYNFGEIEQCCPKIYK